MILALGTKLGRYEIRLQLGAGGMGEVYRARDTELGRDVAVKVLPATFSDNTDRLHRFQQEACAAGALNHPNILSIYDVGKHNSFPYVVSELLEGETLRQRVSGTPLVQRRAIDYALQIANGLAAAHEKGIIHRDLKPDNIFITNDDRVKILDFGLAKLIEPDENQVRTDVPTRRIETNPGDVVGTVGYMSPEQLKGGKVDQRSDIFSFGACLYEMLSGRRAFHGESSAETISAILKEDPPNLSDTNKTVSPALERLVNHCLEKNPEARFHSTRDIAFALEALSESSVSAPTETAPLATTKGTKRERLWWMAALIFTALIVGVTAWLLRRVPATTSRPLARFPLELPANLQLAQDERPVVVFSPDGRELVYVLSNGTNTQLYIRLLDQIEATPIPGTEGASGPFFSPDGQWIGFIANNKLKKVSLKGGAPLNLCNSSPVTRGASWGPDDSILIVQAHSEGISRVSASGGIPQVVTTPDAKKGEIGHYWPEILPGGKYVLFTIAMAANFDEAHIAVQSLETGVQQTLVRGGSDAHYVPTGHLVYVRAGSVMAVPFDLEQLKVTGTAVPVIEGVMVDPWSGAGHFSFSGVGSLVYVTGSVGVTLRTLLWVDRRGAIQPLTDIQRRYLSPSLSPDGRRLAVVIYGISQDIWVYEFARGTLTRLTFEGSEDWGPIWTSDSQRVTFTSSKPGTRPNIFWKLGDGSGTEEQLTISQDPQFTGSWSRDGKTLAFTAGNDPTTGTDIWVLTLEGERHPRPFIRTTFNEYGPEFSPDGQWLAYVSNESGRNEVYVQPFPGPGAKRQISTEGGVSPLWAGNGRELFYRHDDKIITVAITLQPEFTAAAPRLLFAGKYEETGRPDDPRNYDVTPDGQRFVMIRASELPSKPTQLFVALEWFDDLRQRVPGK